MSHYVSFEKSVNIRELFELIRICIRIYIKIIVKIDKIILILLDAASRPSVKNLFWKAKCFEHFHHVYNLVRDCKTRVEWMLENNGLAYQMPEDLTVQIGIVGLYTEDNINLISKRPGSIYSNDI